VRNCAAEALCGNPGRADALLTRKRTESAAAERAECVGRPHSSADDVGQEWGRRREERRLQLSRSGLQAMGRIEGVEAECTPLLSRRALCSGGVPYCGVQ
jgi:hypothetical protein